MAGKTTTKTKMPRRAVVEEQAEAACRAFKALLLANRTRQPAAEIDRRFDEFSLAMRPFNTKKPRQAAA